MDNQLLLGSGTWHWDGWKTLDADATYEPDYVCQVPPLPQAVMSQQWDTILAAHFVEHLYKWDAETLIRQCYACLAVGGALIMEQPDIMYCARVLLGLVDPPLGEPGQFDMWGFYGSPKERNPLMGHRWGYSPESLADVFVKCGFQRQNISFAIGKYHSPVRDFIIQGIK